MSSIINSRLLNIAGIIWMDKEVSKTFSVQFLIAQFRYVMNIPEGLKDQNEENWSTQVHYSGKSI